MSPRDNAQSGSSLYRGSTKSLLATSGYAVVSTALLLGVSEIPPAGRIALGVPLLLFVPGYAVLGAVLPTGSDRRPRLVTEEAGDRTRSSFPVLTRGVLAVVTSLAVVPMVVLAVDAAVGVRLQAVLGGVVAVTLLGSATGVVRSRSAPRATGGATDGLAGPDPRRVLADPLTLVAVVVTVALLAASGALAVTDTTDPSPETEFYVAGGDGANATTAGGSFDLRVRQDEVATQEYTVVVVHDAPEGWAELDRFSVTVAAGETAGETYRARPGESGTERTLRFLLFEDGAPQSPEPDLAHRTLRQTVGEDT